MKIAYIFHGHSRTWDKCYQSFFDNIFNLLPGDIFIHTWDRVSASSGSYWNGYRDELAPDLLEIANAYPDFSGIYKTFKPKVMLVEEHPFVDISGYPYQTAGSMKAHVGAKFMLKSRRTIFEQAVKYNNYDRIFSLRLDIAFRNPINIDEYKDDRLYKPPKSMAIDLWNHGTPRTIDILTNYYSNIDECWLNKPNFDKDPYEAPLERYLTANGVNPLVASSSNYTVVRPF